MKLNIRRIFFIVSLLILLTPQFSFAAKIDQEYRRIARRYGFKLESRPRFRNGISGERLSVEETEKELDRFFKALSVLPQNFVKKSGINKVMICKDLRLYKKPAGGVAYDDCIYLNSGFHPRTVYHELFHVFDPKDKIVKWTKLNHRSFRYQGSEFYPQRDNKKNRRHKRTAQALQADFVSTYAQSFEWEDRAETFAYMIAEKEKFLSRISKSQVLKKKMYYIIEITSSRRLLGKKFWEKHLGISASDID